MVDLTSEMAQLWSSLGPPIPGHGRVMCFAAASAGEGTSTVAREFASYAAERVRRNVWLVDLDLPRNGQSEAFGIEADRLGRLGREAAASPDGSMFFTIQPPLRAPDGRPYAPARYLTAQQAGERRLWVTRFRREMLRAGQSAHVLPTGDYWAALRRHADLVVVDAPPLSRSQAVGLIAPFMDFVVLVVAADSADVRGAGALRDAVTAAGGRCAGIVFNRARIEAPAFLKAVAP